MPKAIKKRVTKKIAIQEEEVKGIATQAIGFIRERRKLFIIIASVVGAVVAASVIFMIYTASLAKEAYSFEREAHNYYYNRNLNSPLSEDERLKKALELYRKSLTVKSTPVVQFYVGNCYYRLNDYDNAIKSYKTFIDKYRGEEGILPLVYQKLAASYIKTGRNDEAFKTFDLLKKFENGAFKDTALIGEARLYEAAGRTEEAKKRYAEIIEEFPDSLWSSEARARMEVKEQKTEK